MTLHQNKLESPSSKNALCQVWLVGAVVLEQKMKSIQTDGQKNNGRSEKISIELRRANEGKFSTNNL